MKAKHEERMLAIWQSVEHWFENYEIAVNPNGTPDDLHLGGRYCALCHYDSNLSNPTHEKTNPPDEPVRWTCVHCPIAGYAKKIECRNTPYPKIDQVIQDYYGSPNYTWTDENRRILADCVALEYGFLVDVVFAEYEEIWA